MSSLLPSPVLQFCDPNGVPYAGGTIDTYVGGTSTPVTTYQNMAGTIPNPNPIVLDSAGRAIIWGSGNIRMVLRDVNGNLVWDQLTRAYLGDDAISPAMLPVTQAVDLETARRLLGIDDLIQQMLDSINLMPGPVGPTGPTGPIGVTGPTGPAGAAATMSGIQGGHVLCSGGMGHVTFSPPFNNLAAFVVTVNGNAFVSLTYCANSSNYGADIWVTYGGSGTPATVEVSWLAWGN